MHLPRPTLRRRVWEIVEVADDAPARTRRASAVFDWIIIALIVLNVLALIAESVAPVGEALWPLFRAIDAVTAVVFSIEYIARLWSSTASSRYPHPVTGRLRYAVRPMLLIDLLAVLPFWLPFMGVELVILRALRLVRVFRIAKVGRYFPALRLLGRVIVSRKEELVVTATVTLLLLLISSSLIYYAERGAQPDAYTSIPAAMWWAIATLTTVGYGDVYPITAAGRFLGAITAVLGIGLFALPTGILGSGFVEELEKSRRTASGVEKHRTCPHCGEPVNE
jgi:voltage-gated potassium channel